MDSGEGASEERSEVGAVVELPAEAIATLKKELPRLSIATSPTASTRETPFERFLGSHKQPPSQTPKTKIQTPVNSAPANTAIAKPARVRFLAGDDVPDFQSHVISSRL